MDSGQPEMEVERHRGASAVVGEDLDFLEIDEANLHYPIGDAGLKKKKIVSSTTTKNEKTTTY